MEFLNQTVLYSEYPPSNTISDLGLKSVQIISIIYLPIYYSSSKVHDVLTNLIHMLLKFFTQEMSSMGKSESATKPNYPVYLLIHIKIQKSREKNTCDHINRGCTETGGRPEKHCMGSSVLFFSI